VTAGLEQPLGVARWQRLLLSGGMLDSNVRTRTLRDWMVDVAMFVGAVAVGSYLLGSTWSQHSTPLAVVDVVLGSVTCAALWLRRRHPVAVALLAVSLAFVSGLANGAVLPALFNAAIRAPFRRLAGIAALSVAGTAVYPLLYRDVHGHGYLWQVSVGVLLTAVALGWGLFVRAQRELVRALHERAARADTEQQLRLQQAREAERRRIAREMHDVLAHRLTILSVHAGALERAGEALPREYAEAAGVIRASAHTALAELREVIGLLRDRDAVPVPEPPQPTLEQIPALVEESRLAGLLVRCRFDVADQASVLPAIGRTAYRTVQEGLTNARKHGGGGSCDVTVETVDGSTLVVELLSHKPSGAAGLAPRPNGEGPNSAAPPGTGAGLVGLAERVALAGGELVHGPDAHGNFLLRATLPWAT
jgi:signal transduction histidine kinase